MLRILLLQFFLLLSLLTMAKTIVVKNEEELKKANKEASPGDTVILQNGEWNHVTIALDCKGTKGQPIVFKAANAGKVLITGNSMLKLGGSFIIVDGLYFTDGYAGSDAIIKFNTDKNNVANNCRVTNTVINDFNNPKRLDENYWIALYGKNNRLDHCSFFNKKNMGVMLAVILDDERSRENFHSIDHNYFGFRLPLASNSGEIIRVGVSEHCQFNSNTQITDNFFEHCDGETEVISIKSCRNIVRNNLFKECQGGVVLRHGNFNTVEHNVFLGNNKVGTGGVRIINKGQWVINNLFYKCRGEGFRSPLSIMNGVPHSPANRYVEVSEAVIANNSFFECTPISFCEGSDTERSVAPHDVQFLNNIFYNTRDTLVYHSFDDMNGIHFSGNTVSKTIKQQMAIGFIKTTLTAQKTDVAMIPAAGIKNSISDSVLAASKERQISGLSTTPGFSDAKRFLQIEKNAYTDCGVKWFSEKNTIILKKKIKADCKTTADIIEQLKINQYTNLTLNLTGAAYFFDAPLNIDDDVSIISPGRAPIKFLVPASNGNYFIRVKAGKTFSLTNLRLDLAGVNTAAFITTDTSGSSNHSNISVNNCRFENLKGTFLHAAKTSVADSIIISNSSFNNGKGLLFDFMTETDKKGYYNVEKLKITNCSITNHNGQLLAMLRSGNDESTMGPSVIFSKNMVVAVQTNDATKAIIELNGIQKTLIEENSFSNCNAGVSLILYKDAVRAVHLFRNNNLVGAGKIIPDKFVIIQNKMK